MIKSWYRNAEGYYSPTEGQAIENIMREEAEKRKRAAMKRKKLEEQKKAERDKQRAKRRKEAFKRRMEQLDKKGAWSLAWTGTCGTIPKKKEGAE